MEALNGHLYSPHDERRQLPRLRCSVEAKFRDLYKPHENFLGSLVENLGVKGLRLITPKFLSKDARLVALLSLPGVISQPMRMICRVAWVRETLYSDSRYECGLEFIEITPDDRKLLAGCVERGVVFTP